MRPNDVVITGPPRSGTTLACELLNDVADTVALDEPIDVGPWLGRPASIRVPRLRLLRRRLVKESSAPVPEPAVVCDLVERFFTEVRAELLAGRGAISKTVGGEVTGNKFPDRRGRSGHRKTLATRSLIAAEKPLSDDFILAVKHVSGFAAILEDLAKRFRCYAIVRNPLSTLSSWQTVQTRFRDGRIPRAERIDEELKRTLDAIPSAIDRQFVVLRWFYDRFADFLPPSAVIRYEDVIATGGRVLAPIAPCAAELDRPLDNRNRSPLYDRRMMKELGERLLAEDGSWWRYYTPDSVRELMETA